MTTALPPRPAAPGTTGHSARKLKPGSAGYIVGALLFVLSFVVAGIWLGIGTRGIISDIENAPTASGSESMVELEADKKYVIYYDVTSVMVQGDPELFDPDGNQVPLGGVIGTASLDRSDGSYVGRYSFTSGAAGEYRFSRGDGARDGTVLFGPSIVPGIFGFVVGPMIVGTIMGLAGIALIIVTFVRRRSDKRRRDNEYGGANQQGFGHTIAVPHAHTSFPAGGYVSPPGAAQPPPPSTPTPNVPTTPNPPPPTVTTPPGQQGTPTPPPPPSAS